jgi:hypothetical protein
VKKFDLRENRLEKSECNRASTTVLFCGTKTALQKGKAAYFSLRQLILFGEGRRNFLAFCGIISAMTAAVLLVSCAVRRPSNGHIERFENLCRLFRLHCLVNLHEVFSWFAAPRWLGEKRLNLRPERFHFLQLLIDAILRDFYQ